MTSPARKSEFISGAPSFRGSSSLVEGAEKRWFRHLITASHAGESGPDVFAVPVPVDSPASAGACFTAK